MKLSSALLILLDLRFAVCAAFPSLIYAIFRAPLLLFRPIVMSRIFMANVWTAFGDTVDIEARPVKAALIPENAAGVVLDLGAGDPNHS